MKRNLHPQIKLAGVINYLIIFGALIVVFGTFAQQHYLTSVNFWLIWCLKNVAVMASLAIPLIIGMKASTVKSSNKVQIIILSVFWLLMMGVKLVTPSPTVITGSLYLITRIGPSLLCYLVLLAVGPIIKFRLQAISLPSLRKVVGGLAGIYLVSSLVLGTKWLGITGGQTIIAYIALFIIGIWIQTDPLIKQLRSRLLIPATVLATILAIFVSWLNTNVVNYDPHHGMTTTLHYLDGISLNQPLMIVACVGILIIVQRFWLTATQLKPQDTILLGTSYLWLMYPQVLATNLTLLINKAHHWPLFATLGLLVVLAIVLTLVIRLVIHLTLSLANKLNLQQIDPLPVLKRFTIQAWRTWSFIGTAWLITVISIWHLWNWKLDMLQWMILNREMVIFINVVMIYAFFAILMAIVNRYWFASVATLTSYAVWLVINLIKISSRSEPVLPVDASMVSSLGSINDLLKLVSPLAIVGVIIVILLACLAAGLLQHFDSTKRWQLPKRIVMILLSVILLSSFRVSNHPGSIAAKSLSYAKDKPYFYSQLRAAKLNGTLLQFANNIDVTVMDKPAGYSEKTMRNLQKKYHAQAKQINQHRHYQNMDHQTVVFVLSESFADPTDVPNLQVQGDPIPYIHSLEKTTTSGKMISSGYGGGTANMEYQALTSLSMTNFSPTLPTPYSQLVPYQKQTFAASDLFSYRVAIHPFTANLYNRKQVYQKLGFNKFYHLQGGDKLSYTAKIQNSPYISDESAYSQTLQQITGHTGGQFINLVTMQNHMPFDNYYQSTDYPVSGTAFADAEHKKNIENYIQGLHYTDTALKGFNEKLNKVHKPVTVVWYGDHLPGIYNGDSMQQYGIQLHSTDYLIYGNKYSPAHNVKLAKHCVVSPNNFAAMLLKQMGVKVSPYYALMTRVYEKLPALALNPFDGAGNNTANGSSIMVSQHEQTVSKLSKKQKVLLHDYKLVQYDLTAGKGYLANSTFMDR